jgi:hypothetical protein
MAEPICDFDLNAIRCMVTKSEVFDGRIACFLGEVTVDDVRGMVARLELAERRLAAVLAVVRQRHERAKRTVETAAQLDDSETRVSLRAAEAREGMAQSVREDVEEAANG